MGSIDTAVDFLLEVTETDRRFPMGFVRVGGKIYVGSRMYHSTILYKVFGLGREFSNEVLHLFDIGAAVVLYDGSNYYVKVEHSPNITKDEMWLGLHLLPTDEPEFVKIRSYKALSPVVGGDYLFNPYYQRRPDPGRHRLIEKHRAFLNKYLPKVLAVYDRKVKQWAA